MLLTSGRGSPQTRRAAASLAVPPSFLIAGVVILTQCVAGVQLAVPAGPPYSLGLFHGDHYRGGREITASPSAAQLVTPLGPASVQRPATSNLSIISGISPASGGVPLEVFVLGYAQGGTPPYTYATYFGDGSSYYSNETGNTTHNYTVAGNYTMYGWVNDSARHSLFWNGGVVVEAHPPVISLPVFEPATIELGQTTNGSFNVSGGYPPYYYSWMGLPQGCTENLTPRVTCTPVAAGTYYISGVVEDSAFVSASSPYIELNVTIPQLGAPLISISHYHADVGELVSFSSTLSSPGSGGLLYNWTGLPGGCNVSYAPSFSCTPSVSGVFPVTLNVTDSIGTSSNSTVTLYVSPALDVLSVASSRATVDNQTAVSLSATVSGGSGDYLFSWTGLPPGCVSLDASVLNCTPSDIGQYVVRLRLSDSNGGSGESAGVSLDVVPQISLSASLSPTQPVAGSPFLLELSVSGGQQPYLVLVNRLPSGCYSTANTTQIGCTLNVPGTYAILANASDSAGGKVSRSISWTVELPETESTASRNPWSITGPATAGIIVIGAIAVAFWIRRVKRRRPPVSSGL